MPLVSGTRLGVYEIVSAIGAGGMGEVYRARDTRLNRDVAIKILPPLFASDPERLSRFEREARTLAALNHPNVAHVYGLEEQALAMELVEGEDLAQRLSRGAIPVDETIQIALQIACGVEAAHERGIVHRDLKPANVKVAPDGTVKVLDFGLAKAFDPYGSGPIEPVSDATVTSPATQMGVIVGTAAYMAPEQARGKLVDKRADNWAFGCVLFEMLTGKRPFGGETVTDMLAAIVKEEPDWKAVPADTPPTLERLISYCLVKDPKQRLRDIGDARITLERIAGGATGESATAASPAQAGRARRGGVVRLAAGALAGAALAMLAMWLAMKPAHVAPPPLAWFATPLPLEALPLRAGGAGVAFSPDGMTIVYAAQPALRSTPSLFRRRLDGLEVERIPHTDNANAPFFSPDGRWIGFFTDAALMKVPADGQGAAVKIADRGRFSRAAWCPGDTIVLGTSQIHSRGPLAKVSAGGGTPADFTALAGAETAHQLPHLLPDGRHVIFTAISAKAPDLVIVPIEGGSHRSIGVEGSGPAYVAPGHLLFARGRSMFTVPFDQRTVRTTGTPVQVLDDAAVFSIASNVFIPILGVDRAGSVAYVNRGGTLSTVRWISATPVTVPVPEADYRTPRLSPDGRRLVAGAGSAPSEIWVIDLDRGTRLLLGTNGGVSPVWSHDGQRVIYASPEGDIRTVPADGSGSPEVVMPRQESINVTPISVAPNGSYVVLNAENRAIGGGARNRDVWTVRAGEKPVPVIATGADERGAVVSPDGQWLAYSSTASGREEIYIKSLSGTGRTIPVSSQGGTLPRWPRMDSLYFLGPRTLMRVSVGKDAVSFGTPAEVTVLPQNMGGIDIDAAGRILIVEPRESAGTRDTLHVILNWGASLK